ncbi:MAG: type II pantothenate kinase [Muribaculaceae bacterium]|jgi:type II pantothenate kinase|nr:type II pantothenate kinase [Muribaculaceae bacterium]MBR5674720.1 type II pantothenate kinase [Muribaculaceae bacterium]
MSQVIGIDVGGSTTKIVGIENGTHIKSPMNITANDPITSLFGAFGKYLYDNNIALEDVEHVMLTGVGASGVTTPIYGLPTTHVDEFRADGLGARFVSGLQQLIVVSMGTGTTLVRVDGDDIAHIGGISMGGGTLQGLSHLLLKDSHIQDVIEMAQHGDISRINLQIKDISKGDIEGLPMHATASLFGKVLNSNPNDNDIAKGLICMVLETIGSCAVLSQVNGGFKDYVLIGNLTLLPECQTIFPMMESLYGVRFHIPEHARYCTALGAALSYQQQSMKP